MDRNKLFETLPSQSSGIPPSLRYGATFPALWTRRKSKSEGGFRRGWGIRLPEPAQTTSQPGTI